MRKNVMAAGYAIWLMLLGELTMGAPVVLMVLAAAGVALVETLAVLTISRWPRYWVAVAIAATRGKLPPRPAEFLDSAYWAGLLRLSGAAGTQSSSGTKNFKTGLTSGTSRRGSGRVSGRRGSGRRTRRSRPAWAATVTLWMS
jgi:uncharacterized membrane protein YgcG